MKKTNIFAAVASLALLAGMFTGCVTDNPDLEAVGNLDGYYIRGELYEDGWNIKDDSNKLVADTEKGSVGFYYAKFKALGESGAWKIANDDWTKQFNQGKGNMTIGSLPEGVKNEQVDDGNGGLNEKLVGLKTGQWYKINVIATATAVEVSLEETEGTAEVVPVPYYLDGMYLVGGVFKIDGKDNAFAFSTENLIWGASTNKKTGVVTYTKDIKAIATSGELGINDSSWNNKQLGVGVTIAAGAEEAVALNGTAGNFNVTGLTVGKPYRVEISTTPEKVLSIKIYEIAEVTLSFKVKGLNEGDSAWINGSIWGDGWPQGWPIVAWNSNDAEKTAGFISAHPAAVADASGVATFDSKWNKTFISKIGDTKSWECKVIYIEDGASWDGEGTVKDSGDNLKFDYNVTAGGSYTFVIDAANGWKISVE